MRPQAPYDTVAVNLSGLFSFVGVPVALEEIAYRINTTYKWGAPYAVAGRLALAATLKHASLLNNPSLLNNQTYATLLTLGRYISG